MVIASLWSSYSSIAFLLSLNIELTSLCLYWQCPIFFKEHSCYISDEYGVSQASLCLFRPPQSIPNGIRILAARLESERL